MSSFPMFCCEIWCGCIRMTPENKANAKYSLTQRFIIFYISSLECDQDMKEDLDSINDIIKA